MLSNPLVVIGTLDTKGEEIAFLRRQIELAGHQTIVMDLGTKGEPYFMPDISAEEVASTVTEDLARIKDSRDTASASRTMIKGAIAILSKLDAVGKIGGVISIGGASGTTMASSIMQSLPFGIPKVIVSSTAAMPEYAARYFGTKDLLIFHSVVDIAGMNSLVKDVLIRAAGCICGMVGRADSREPLLREEKVVPRVAITEFKFSEQCCNLIRRHLEELGLEVIAYHAQGIGDRAMEEAVEQGLFDAVLDVVPAGLSEELLGGNRAAGSSRMEAAGKVGIPQVLTPCGFDMISCGPLERRDKNDLLWVKRNLTQRKLYVPDAYRVQARTSGEELRQVARLFADKLNLAKGPVEVLIPMKGWSSLSEEGGALYNREGDEQFVNELQRWLSKQINLTLLNYSLNHPVFAQAVIEKLFKHIKFNYSNSA